MPNPIIIIFEYHQVPAGELLLQANLPDLIKEGYKTYLDEEASNVTLERKLRMANDVVLKAQDIPEASEEIWQKVIVTVRKKTIDLLVTNKFNYFAYDLPESELQALLLQNLDVLRSHPQGMTQGMNDLLSGKIAHRMQPYEKRVAYQNEAFAKKAVNAKDGVVCIAGIYHAHHLQSYLRDKFPGQDVLTFFPYQGIAFEAFEEKARSPETNSSVFPYKAKLVNMDSNGEKAKNIINDDLTLYKKMVDQLQNIELIFNQPDSLNSKIQEIQDELNLLKTSIQKLDILNNIDTYLFTVGVYLLKCAIEAKDLSYIKANYDSVKKIGNSIPKTPIKDKLIVVCKEIVGTYQAEQKLKTERPASFSQSFFAGKSAVVVQT